MSLIERLALENEWETFFSHKTIQGNITGKEAEDLRAFIDKKEYLPVVEKILNGKGFSFPKKTLISKSKKGKKRTVYTFLREENYVLKLLAFLLRNYDAIFAPNLYSFRKERGVKRATNDVLNIKNLNSRYVYKVDISDYFNSVDISLLLPMLERFLCDDRQLFGFIKSLLLSPNVEFEGEIIEEQKGIMAGVPISGFLANLYLRELDFYFYENKIPYMRYSDDIIIFTKTLDELENYSEYIKDFLNSKNLKVNPEKEISTLPFNEWTFLGFSYNNGIIDISDVSFEKLKAKMKRKTNALARWASIKNISGERAAKAFVKRFNAKLYDNPIHNELTWTRWFFPIINTDKTLKKIDEYMQDCIRYLATGKRTKARYNFRYEDIKALGYKSLVNEYYKLKNEDNEVNYL